MVSASYPEKSENRFASIADAACATGRPYSGLAGAVICQALADARDGDPWRSEEAVAWLAEGAGSRWAAMLGGDAVVADELDELERRDGRRRYR